jgi:hypothetical protein
MYFTKILNCSAGCVEFDSSSDLSYLLNYSGLVNLASYKHFLPLSAFKGPTEIKVTLNNQEYTCTFQINGTMSISPTPSFAQENKIQFASMGIESS